MFLHEGAKAARSMAHLIARNTSETKAAYDAHPWNMALSYAAHVGWIGGADNAYRTDWQPLLRLAKSRTIYAVADNDAKGKNAVSHISRRLRRKMTAILFDDDFPGGFDLADEWPMHKKWWAERDKAQAGEGHMLRYIGPSLHDLSHPATWATEPVFTGKSGRPAFTIRDDFASEWLVSQDPHLFAHTQSNHLLAPEVFNRTVAPFSDVDDTARLLVKNLSVHADGITYQPALPKDLGRLITVDGKKLINTYRAPTIRPLTGHPGPFLDFIDRMFPIPSDRSEVLRWCATLIARPDVRMHYGLLLISRNTRRREDNSFRRDIGPFGRSLECLKSDGTTGN